MDLTDHILHSDAVLNQIPSIYITLTKSTSTKPSQPHGLSPSLTVPPRLRVLIYPRCPLYTPHKPPVQLCALYMHTYQAPRPLFPPPHPHHSQNRPAQYT